MFGLFKRKPTAEEFEQAKRDGSVYPGQSITLLQIETANGAKGTAWVNKAYKGYRFKEFCPHYVIVRVNLSDSAIAENEELDMSTIEDFFDGKLRSIGVSHFIGRFVTDNGMDLLFYTEANPHFEEVLTELMNENEFNLDIEVEINEHDSKWRSMAMVLN